MANMPLGWEGLPTDEPLDSVVNIAGYLRRELAALRVMAEDGRGEFWLEQANALYANVFRALDDLRIVDRPTQEPRATTYHEAERLLSTLWRNLAAETKLPKPAEPKPAQLRAVRDNVAPAATVAPNSIARLDKLRNALADVVGAGVTLDLSLESIQDKLSHDPPQQSDWAAAYPADGFTPDSAAGDDDGSEWPAKIRYLDNLIRKWHAAIERAYAAIDAGAAILDSASTLPIETRRVRIRGALMAANEWLFWSSPTYSGKVPNGGNVTSVFNYLNTGGKPDDWRERLNAVQAACDELSPLAFDLRRMATANAGQGGPAEAAGNVGPAGPAQAAGNVGPAGPTGIPDGATADTKSMQLVLGLYTGGVSDDRMKAVCDIVTGTGTANDKLAAFHAKLPIPGSASAKRLGKLLGVSATAIKKTDWWNENRKGEKQSEIGRRHGRHLDRAKVSDTHITPDDR